MRTPRFLQRYRQRRLVRRLRRAFETLCPDSPRPTDSDILEAAQGFAAMTLAVAQAGQQAAEAMSALGDVMQENTRSLRSLAELERRRRAARQSSSSTPQA